MAKKRADLVSKDEMTAMIETGALSLAKRRTEAIQRQHVAGDSPISYIARDSYLQGIRDCVQALTSKGIL